MSWWNRLIGRFVANRSVDTLPERPARRLEPLPEPLGPIVGPVSVVVSRYDARPIEPLVALLDALREKPAGWAFDLRVVVNQDSPREFELPPRHRDVTVARRENGGFNIGAWDCGWRLDPPRAAYLFLQDECLLERDDWLRAYVQRAAEPGVGLVGERIPPTWDLPWPQLQWQFGKKMLAGHEIAGRPVDRMTCYRDFWRRQNVPLPESGAHVQSLALFARREVLAAIGGLPIGENYGEAIAAEIGISFLVRGLGLRIAQVGPEDFWCFTHPQWKARAAQHRDPEWILRTSEFRARKLGPHAA